MLHNFIFDDEIIGVLNKNNILYFRYKDIIPHIDTLLTMSDYYAHEMISLSSGKDFDEIYLTEAGLYRAIYSWRNEMTTNIKFIQRITDYINEYRLSQNNERLNHDNNNNNTKNNDNGNCYQDTKILLSAIYKQITAQNELLSAPRTTTVNNKITASIVYAGAEPHFGKLTKGTLDSIFKKADGA